jgi:hypothetical protein
MKLFTHRFLVLLLIATTFIACKNNDKKDNKENGKTEAEKLMEEVMDGHNVGMAKYGKLQTLQKEVHIALDSIAKLPADLQDKAEAYRKQLQSAATDLNKAITGMDKWMEEFNMDSALDDLGRRIKYLLDEKLKVNRVKEEILMSIAKADSLLRK